MSESTRGRIAPPEFSRRLKRDGDPGGEDQRSYLLRGHHLWIGQ
jgi:hypothetical protein